MGEFEIAFCYNEVFDKKTSNWTMDVDVTVDEYKQIRCQLVIGPDTLDPMASLHTATPDSLYATIRNTDPHLRVAVYKALRLDSQPLINCLNNAVYFVPMYGKVNRIAVLGGRGYNITLDGIPTQFRWYPGSMENTFIVSRSGKIGHYEYKTYSDEEATIVPLEGYSFQSGFFRKLNDVLQKQLYFIGDIQNALFSN